MPVPHTAPSLRQPNPKRVKRDHVATAPVAASHFLTGDDIRKALTNAARDMLRNDLFALRNQLTIQHAESISPQDNRLLLVKNWLGQSPGALEVFNIWDGLSQGQTTQNAPIASLCISVLSSLLSLLSTHFVYQSFGMPILKKLLSQTYIRRLNGYIGGAQTELILVSLKLLNAMVEFAGGCEKKTIMEGFAWGLKSLPKLLFMRRKGAADVLTDPLVKPDIRTLYIMFILSFLSKGTPTSIKISLLEDHRDVFLSIYKGIGQDPYAIAKRILEASWEGVWCDAKIRRTLKVGLFTENTVQSIMKLYDRPNPEGADAIDIPADLAHHFLLAIMTRPGTGICFKDHGWYPRQGGEEEDVEGGEQRSGKIHNKILANLLKGLKVGEDSRQMELADKILQACPELVAGYWASAGLTLEPRLSSRWIANISFFGKIISHPIPTPSFSSSADSYNPTPPPLSAILSNILPSALSKAHLSKGLQSNSGLVQHCTALALAKCLAKYSLVCDAFSEIEQALEEDVEGQWTRRRIELEREIQRRVPEFQVIVALSQAKHTDDNLDRERLLGEAALRLMWLYHRLLPELVGEARFEVGKLLLGFVGKESTQNGADEVNNVRGLSAVAQLHVLRLLKDSDQFSWSAKLGSTSHTHLYHLLQIYTHAIQPSTRVASSSLLINLLSRSILFEHDPNELEIWLSALPRTRRSPSATAPDSSPLTPEDASVLGFLDDCIQRCLKTPYRYLEDCNAVFQGADGRGDGLLLAQVSSRPDIASSPLLMAVMEQFGAKLKARLLSASDALALATYVRRLILSLVCKQPDLGFGERISERLGLVLSEDNLESYSCLMRNGVLREARVLRESLQHLKDPVIPVNVTKAHAIQEFLSAIESVSVSSGQNGQWNASELIDWIRLIDHPMHADDVTRLAAVINRWSVDANILRELFFQLEPANGQLWACFSGSNLMDKALQAALSFEWGYLHSNATQLCSGTHRALLVKILSARPLSNSNSLPLGLIFHRLSRNCDDGYVGGSLSLLADVFKMVHQQDGYATAKINTQTFQDCHAIRDLCMASALSPFTQQGLHTLIECALKPTQASDLSIAADFCRYWLLRLQDEITTEQMTGTLPWIAYMEPSDLLVCYDAILSASIRDSQEGLVCLEKILHTILLYHASSIAPRLHERLPTLLSLKSIVTTRGKLDRLLITLLEAPLPLGHDGQSPPSDIDTVQSLARSAEDRWARRHELLPETLSIKGLLEQAPWDETSARLSAALIYRSSRNCADFAEWLISQSSFPQTPHFALVLHAFLDSLSSQPPSSVSIPQSTTKAVEYIGRKSSSLLDALFTLTNSREVTHIYAACLSNLLRWPLVREACLDATLSRLKSVQPAHIFNTATLSFFSRLAAQKSDASEEVIDVIAALGLQWMVRRFAEDELDAPELLLALEIFGKIIEVAEDVKPHLAEPVLTAAIQNRLHSTEVVSFIAILARRISIKPVNLNRILQAVLQHPFFYQGTELNDAMQALPSRQSIIKLLHTLFFMHPTNTCQPSHIAPLTRIYRGTLSHSDRLLLSIFWLFEQHRHISVASLLRRWSAQSAVTTGHTLNAIMSLDSAMVFRTCTSFPQRGVLLSQGQRAFDHNHNDPSLYDPMFVMLLMAHLVMDDQSGLTGMDWVQVFRTNAVGLAICALGSRESEIRRMAATILAAVWKSVEAAAFQERDQALRVLNMLRNLLPPPDSSDTAGTAPRLATYPLLLLAHALRAVFYPSAFLYPIVSRFLLQRPELDAQDVPMLFGLLYSASEDWHKERAWMIKFIADGMRGSEDWRVLKRRHTWDLLASLFQASGGDKPLRKGILEVLTSISANAQAATSLVLRSSILSWIELQLLNETPATETEAPSWVKILDNVLRAVDAVKVEKATRGVWREMIGRCLLILVKRKGSADHLYATMELTLRLCLLPFSSVSTLPAVLQRAFTWLQAAEQSVQHALYTGHPDVKCWARCVRAMWRIRMTLEEEHDISGVWEGVTARLVAWNAVLAKGADGCEEGEWARRESIRCLSEG